MAASLILFHDPYEGMLQLYQAMLARSPYQGYFTHEAGEAFMLCRTLPVSLVVTDFDTLIRGEEPLTNLMLQDSSTAHIPILLVTVFDYWRDAAATRGIAGVLRKPFTHTLLLDAIQQALYHPMYTQAIS